MDARSRPFGPGCSRGEAGAPKRRTGAGPPWCFSRYLVEDPPVQKDSSSCFGSMSSSSAGMFAKSAYLE